MKTRIYKALSILLALAVVFSACACILGTVSADEPTYDVSSTGEFKTIEDAVKAAKTAGKDAGDVVVAKVADSDSVAWAASSIIAEHAFKLVITSDNGATVRAADGENIILNGPTEFGNVTITVPNYKDFRFNDQNVTFAANNKWGTMSYGAVTLGHNVKNKTVPQTIILPFRTGKDIAFANNNSESIYDADINFIYDGQITTNRQRILLGNANNSTTTYNKNINVDIRSGIVSFVLKDNVTFGENSAIQVINSSGRGIDSSPNNDGGFSAITGVDKWVLTNNSTKYKEALSFTETAGKYSVAEGYTATATKGGVLYPTENGVLDLTAGGAGTYSVDIERPQRVADVTYNVDSVKGDDATTDPNTTHFKTIEGAVKYAIDKAQVNKEGSNVTVKLFSNSAQWAELDTITAHKFNLIVTSETGAEVVPASGKNIILGGPTEFSNVKLVPASKSFKFNDKDVKLGAGTTVSTSGYVTLSTNTNALTNDVNIEVLNAIGKPIMLSNDGYGNKKTYDKNINVVYDYNDATKKQTFSFGSAFSDSSTTYKKNVNFNIKSGVVALDNGRPHTFAEGSALQIINSSGNPIENLDGVSDTPKKFILNNRSGNKNLIEFTATAGKFKINSEHTVIAVKKGDTTQHTSVNGELDLTVEGAGAGEYTITVVRDTRNEQYYVGTGATAPNGKLYATIKEVVDAANKDGLAAGDTAQVNIIGNNPVIWSSDSDALPKHFFTLKITSENGAVVTATTQKKQNGDTNYLNMVLGGPTEFGKVTLETCKDNNGQYKDLRFNDSDVIISQDTVVSTKIGNVTLGFEGANLSEAQDVVINSKITKLYMSNSNDKDKTYNEDVNITFNEASASPTFYFGTSAHAGKNSTVYNGLLNINIKAATNVLFASTNFNTPYSFGSDFALQIINSTAQEFSANKDALANIAADKKLIINNRSGDANLIEFAGEKGKFKINTTEDLSKVILKDQNGNQIPVTSDVISLTAGVYNISVNRPAIIEEYFVSPDGEIVEEGKGSDDLGKTKNKPVRSFADVTRLIAQDGLTEKDTAIVRFKAGEENYWWNGTYKDVTKKVIEDGKEVEKTVKEETPDPLSAYSCKIILDSTSASEKATISYNYMIELVGDLTFKNVILNINNLHASLVLNNKNVVFSKESVVKAGTVVVGWRSNSNNVSADNDINITIEGEFDSNIQLGNMYHDGTYNGDITFFVNNENSSAIFLLGGGMNKDKDGNVTSPTTHTFNGNINIHILKAKTFSIAKFHKDNIVNINGGLQVLVDDEVEFPYSVKTNFENFAVSGGKWYVTNAASDDKFVEFTDTKGKFKFTDGKTAYIRQIGAQEHYAITSDGFAILPDGAYTISDSSIPFIPDDSHKMLYYRLAGGVHFLSTRMEPVLVPGEEYVYEYSIYCNLYEDCKPYVTHADKELNPKFNSNGDEALKSYTATKVGNYYKVVCQVVIPEDYEQTKTDPDTKEKYQVPGYTAFFGVWFGPGSEGYIFDRALYKKDDAAKTDLFEGGNADFHDGLDYIKLDDSKTGLWAAVVGDKSLVKFDNGIQQLEVVDFSEEAIAELIRLGNPNDGEWWKVEDIIEEEEIITYASAKGVFKDNTGKAVKNVKMLLISDENEYTAITNSKGEFDFGKIVTGFYELYVLNGSEKIFTGFSQYIAPDDEVTFNVISDLTSALDYETIEPGDNVEEILPSGNLSGTVYTPYLETVANLKLYLEGIGEVTTDENGNFAFADVPVGKYKLYTVLEDGAEYVFRDVEIQENVDLKVKLKYDPPKQSGTDDVNNGWIIWVIVASVVALVVVAGLVFFLVIKKKKAV